MEGGNHDHRQPLVALADLGEQRYAVPARHVDVGHHDVDGIFPQTIKARFGVFRRVDLEAALPEMQGKGSAAGLVVVDYQYAGHGRNAIGFVV